MYDYDILYPVYCRTPVPSDLTRPVGARHPGAGRLGTGRGASAHFFSDRRRRSVPHPDASAVAQGRRPLAARWLSQSSKPILDARRRPQRRSRPGGGPGASAAGRGLRAAGYYEFNFAPSGAWAAYAFSRYRDGAPLAQAVDPRIAVRRAEQQLELDALIRLECLPLAPLCARLQLALSAVIEDKQGVLSYWALTHPPGRPDFHHPDAFVLELERPEATRVSDPAEGGKR